MFSTALKRTIFFHFHFALPSSSMGRGQSDRSRHHSATVIDACQKGRIDARIE
jgi:hypothetical protein